MWLRLYEYSYNFIYFNTQKDKLWRKNLLRESLIYPEADGLIGFLKKVLFFVFTIELLGALLLFLRFKLDMNLSEALWTSVFHSISAFNNAGLVYLKVA